MEQPKTNGTKTRDYYCIISGPVEVTQEAVNRLLEIGYETQGGVSALMVGTRIVMYQAMVKRFKYHTPDDFKFLEDKP